MTMEETVDSSNSSFTSAMALAQMGMSSVPKSYILPLLQRPNIGQNLCSSASVLPIIDLSSLENPSVRTKAVAEVHFACKEIGLFQVINHGIPLSVMSNAMAAASEFFNLPNETKIRYASANVHEPVRYGTSVNHVNDKVHFWRDFIKHYSHPISTWIDLWPSDPPHYKKNMGTYAKAVQNLYTKLMQVILESLGLRSNYLQEDIEEGTQAMTVNCYPACPEPSMALGLPPHSDYGSLTILLQNHPGLEIMDRDKNWQSVPVIEQGLIVFLGDQMEVLSNGRYKSLVHRAILNSQKMRISLASLHSLGLEKKVGPARELVDEQHPLSYKEGSFSEFLNFISCNDLLDRRYIDMLRENDPHIG